MTAEPCATRKSREAPSHGVGPRSPLPVAQRLETPSGPAYACATANGNVELLGADDGLLLLNDLLNGLSGGSSSSATNLSYTGSLVGASACSRTARTLPTTRGASAARGGTPLAMASGEHVPDLVSKGARLRQLFAVPQTALGPSTTGHRQSLPVPSRLATGEEDHGHMQSRNMVEKRRHLAILQQHLRPPEAREPNPQKCALRVVCHGDGATPFTT